MSVSVSCVTHFAQIGSNAESNKMERSEKRDVCNGRNSEHIIYPYFTPCIVGSVQTVVKKVHM